MRCIAFSSLVARKLTRDNVRPDETRSDCHKRSLNDFGDHAYYDGVSHVLYSLYEEVRFVH